MTNVYISGPMTGLPDLNYSAFFRAENMLRHAKFEPINPARRPADGKTSWLDFMRAALRDLADADGVATLEGWQDSRGARLEVEIARSLELPVWTISEWLECRTGGHAYTKRVENTPNMFTCERCGEPGWLVPA